MTKKQIIKKTASFVKKRLSGEGTGHDWWHVFRVWRNAVTIGKKEKADLFVVELAALLHDIADWKFTDGDTSVGSNISQRWLKKMGVERVVIEHVCHIVEEVSFKGAKVKSKIKTLEGRVVQDADRLDALGAIGVARTFAYGGHSGRIMHSPDIRPVAHTSFKKYFNGQSTSINHFYEKMLLLKGLMNTRAGKMIAEKRHEFTKQFLNKFLKEWDGRD
ncbi:HD domain-containing protein [Patescibacteria group bacterium]|nr:MAG: HD domain-containing protein [Patescibacteria group bacterium]